MPFVKRERTYYKYGTEPNASIVGSFARIDKGVASGFSASNYLVLPKNFDVTQGQTWEAKLKFTTGSDVTSEQNPISKNDTTTRNGFILFVRSSKFRFYASSNGSSWDIAEAVDGTYTVLANTLYYVKIVFNGSSYIVSYSTNDVDYVDDITIAKSAPVSSIGYSIGSQATANYFRGTIDLSQSYININGSRWWSGDSYTKVGSWIDDGVVSGFSTSQYLTLPEVFTPSSNTWEQVYKITTGSDVSTNQIFVGNGGAANKIMCGVQSGKFKLWLSSNNSTWNVADASTGSYTVLSSTEYYIRLRFTGTTYTLEYSLNDNEDSYTTDITVSSSALITNSNALSFGANQYGSGVNHPFSGSIDLNESYIKINNKDWWHGTKAYQINVAGEDIWEKWEQPVLTNYGTMGGSSFAVAESSTLDSGEEVWRLFASSPALWHSAANLPQWISWYNPNPLKVTKLSFTSATGNHRNIKDFIIQACDDNSSWIDILSYSNANASGDFEVDLSSNDKAYKYWRIYITSSHYANVSYYAVIGGLKITAQKLMATGTTEEADYYVNHNKLYQLAAIKRSYWKYYYQDFAQPTLTANGTLGGKSFAVAVDSRYDDYSAYKAFDGDASTSWQSNGTTAAGTYFKMYNPNPLNITKIVWSGTPKYGTITAGIVYGSNDDIDYVELATFSDGTTSGGTMDLSSNTNYYKYYKITPTTWTDKSGTYTNGWAELTITAQEQITVAGTSTDYDYYTDRLVSYAPIVRGKRSYYKQADKQRDTGTYTFTLDKEYTAKLLFVGNGGGGCSSQKDSRWHVSSGGSGACFEGIVRLPADTYTLTIGSLGYGNNANNTHYHSSSVVSTDSYLTNSAGQELIRVGAGGNGYTSVGGVGGAAGVLTLGTLDILETKKATDGVYTAGNVSTGSLSAYDNTYTGYGAGTSGTHGQGNVYGIKGIFDLVLETDINDYTYYEDVGTKIY